MTLKTSIERMMSGENLSSVECQQALDDLLNPSVNSLQVAAFLALLRAKKETPTEISAFVNALRNKMIVVPTNHTVLDIVGTGGDGFNTINISTGSAMLAASCGIKVAKHGNRSVSSLTGSADVIEALGIKIELTPDQISKSIDQIGIGFCYSPNFHPVTQALRSFRKELNIPTTFNLLGPLLNPANASHLVLGVMDETLMPVIADVLRQTGSKRSVVVHGKGLDEISCIGPAKIIEITQQEKTEWILDPLKYGLKHCEMTDLRGGDAKINAQILLDTFKGKHESIGNTLILNAAVALYLYGSCKSILDGVSHARDVLYSGAVINLLNNWIEISHDTST